jgi:hypothetical protein
MGLIGRQADGEQEKVPAVGRRLELHHAGDDLRVLLQPVGGSKAASVGGRFEFDAARVLVNHFVGGVGTEEEVAFRLDSFGSRSRRR